MRAAVAGAAALAASLLSIGSRGSDAGIRDLDLVVGWLLLGVGVILWRVRAQRERPAALLAATAIAWLAGGALHRGPLAHLLLAWPTGRIEDRRVAAIVGLAYLDGIVESLIRLDAGTVLYAALLGVTAIGRVTASSGIVRRGRLVAAGGTLLVAGILGIGRLLLFLDVRGTIEPSLVLYGIALVAVAIALVVDLRWGSWSRSTVTGLVVELGSRDDAPSLRARLSEALGDPTLTVGHASGDGGFVDDAGRTVDVPAPGSGRVATPVRDGAETVAVVVHDAAVLDDPALITPVAAATRMAVANLALRSEIDRRQDAIDASQRRLLMAADEQRRRLERRLAEGALDRLDRMRGLISRTVVLAAVADAPIDVASELDAATSELRLFARGVYPRALTEHGLAAAVQAVASGEPGRVTIAIPAVRLSPEVEAAAYFVCAEALANVAKHAAGSRAQVTGALTQHAFGISIQDDGPGGADPHGSGLQGLRDRVAALGGSFTIRSPGEGGTVVEATFPIA